MNINEINQDGAQIALEDGARRWYCNSSEGRTELAAECPPELVAEVLAAWGDTPTMPDAPEMPMQPPQTPQPDPRDLAITQLMREVAALKAKEGERIG